MPKNDIAFALNYTNIHMIDITPGEPDRTWAYMGPGIQTVTPAANEVTDQTAYYDGGGQASTDITGGQTVISFSGHRKYGDPAQDYIASLDYSYGEARKTHYRHVAPNGRVIEGDCTIANIVNGGGDANAKGTFSYEVHFDGIPTIMDANIYTIPASLTVSNLKVKKGGVAKINVIASPEGASNACMFGVEDDTIISIDADGTVHGLAEGKTKVTCKSALKPSLSAQIEVTVEIDPNAKAVVDKIGFAATELEANEILSSTGDVVSVDSPNIFYAIFDKDTTAEDNYLVTISVQDHEYGIQSPGSTRSGDMRRLYFTLGDGKKVDFVDKKKKSSDAAAKCDLSNYTGQAVMTVYSTNTQTPGVYPTGLTQIKRVVLQLTNRSEDV